MYSSHALFSFVFF